MDVKELENIMQTSNDFEIGFTGIHDTRCIAEGSISLKRTREIKEYGVVGVVCEEGVVFISKLSPKTIKTD